MNQMVQDILEFNMSALTFIRPLALWLLLPLGVWGMLHVLSLKQKNNWQKHIATALQPFMITKGSTWLNQWPFISFLLAMLFGIFALSGPSWKKEKMPESKVSARMYVGLCLSSSMLNQDLQPNRIERAKLKIGTLLGANPGVAVGMYVYAGTPHLLLPPTTDYKLINQQLENLNPRMMPFEGNNTRLFFQLIDSTFQKLDAPGTLVWFSDSFSEGDMNRVVNFISGSQHRVEIVPVRSNDDGDFESSQKPLLALKNMKNVTLNSLTLDDSDMEAIAKRVKDSRDFYQDAEDKSEQQRDMGLLFIWPMLVLVASSFRKGAVIFGMFLLMGFGSSCTYDQPHAEWWYSKDKIGYEYYKAGEYEKALDYLQDSKYRALAFYQLGDYRAAAELSSQDTTASGKYNKGLALFNLGLYDEAAQAFNEAHQLNPNLKMAQDAAQMSTKYASENIQSQIQQKEKERLEGQEITEDVGNSKELSKEEFGKKEDKKDPNKKKNEKKMQGGQRTAKEAEKPDLTDDAPEPMASTDILLRKTVADPSDFLRKRFNMQREKYYTNEK